MTRSTIQPDALRLWKVERTDNGLLLHISANWNIAEKQIEDDHGTRTEWQYDTIRFVVPYQGERDAVDTFLQQQEARILLVGKTLWEVKNDQATITADEAKLLKDRETQEAIKSSLHSVAGQGEESGIVREQLVDILNALGIEPNEGFAAYNSTAIAEITKARIEKEALDA